MPEMLPLFPLGTVLCPGVALPLHIFEPRYRRLIRTLIDSPSPRRFGVVAIRQGHEVGPGLPALHDIGCTAELRSVRELPDGRYDIDTVGGRRFRLLAVDDSLPYHQAQVEFLDERAGSDPVGAALQARLAWQRYQQTLGQMTGEDDDEQLPTEPRLLSYALACTGLVDLSDRHALLAADDDTSRLQQAASLLRREAGLLAALRAVPDPSLLRERPSPN
jgi:hypothetical protein